ncbi:MAG: hypothetical protein HONBIEJF_01634 [Fimbriimonadaceae bacterium]|nr:hypothetical protein [Fimbriimonadaceae bacterium]
MPTASPYVPTIGQTIYSSEAVLTGTRYFEIEGSRTPSVTRGNQEAFVDRFTRLMTLRVFVSSPPASGKTVTIKLLKNGSATDLAVTLTSSTSANSWVADLEHEVSANREDLLCFEVTTTGSFPSATIQTVTMTRETS